MATIRFNNVSHQYALGKVRVDALMGIDLEIDHGEMVALTGPSGSGKTTIINLLGTLDTPQSGTIEVNGKDIVGLSASEKNRYRMREVSFVFQSFNLLPTLNVYENVEFPMLFSDMPADELKDRIRALLTKVGLGGYAKRRIDELSGGQRQRVAIARALVTGAPVVLADEPTANLDGSTARDVMELMAGMNRENGTQFVFSTHDSRIIDYATKIVEIRDGRIESVRLNARS
jgi:putative ABC transport system ATP-binding protein